MKQYRQNGFIYALHSNGTSTVLRYNGDSQTLLLHREVQGHTVTEIATGAFRNCHKLFDVTIPSTVTAIGAGAFANCGMDKTPDENLARAYTAHCRRDLEEMFGYGYEYYEDRMMSGEDPYKTGWHLKLTVKRGGYAEQYCRANGIDYVYG